MRLNTALFEVFRQWITSDAVLAEFERQLAAKGYALVPVEPTEAMILASAKANPAYVQDQTATFKAPFWDLARTTLRAGIAASQEPDHG